MKRESIPTCWRHQDSKTFTFIPRHELWHIIPISDKDCAIFRSSFYWLPIVHFPILIFLAAVPFAPLDFARKIAKALAPAINQFELTPVIPVSAVRGIITGIIALFAGMIRFVESSTFTNGILSNLR